jgi:hypothetical protein
MSTLMGRGLLALLALLLGSLPASPGRASADARIELENFVSYEDLGGGPIQRAQCSGALNGWVVDYVDRAGEYVEVELVLPEPVCFVDSLRSAGVIDSVRTIATSYLLMPGRTEVSADTVVTLPGSGVT